MTTFDLQTRRVLAVRTATAFDWQRVLCVLFFFSGFPALIYQLTWQRALFRIFGVNIESVTIVVTAFMLGLGIGSLAGGWLSKRPGIRLLPLLAVIELMTGAFGLVSLATFERVGALALGLPLAVLAVITLALVIVPTLLMGATLPVLVSHLVRRSGNVGSSVGLLYYVNTLGAGAACLACALLLFPFLGMQHTVYVAVAINGAVALGALLANRRDRGDPAVAQADGPASLQRSSPALGLAPVLVLAVAGGFVSLSYEMFLFRAVSYASGSGAGAFAVTLSVFLVGLAAGARQAGRDCETLTPAAIMRRPAWALMAASVVGLLFLPLLDHLAFLGGGLVGAAALSTYLIARFWGSLLPYLAQLGIRSDERAGMSIALLYLANILGSATGCVLTGFVLMDHLGLVALGMTLAVAGLVCAGLLIVSLPIGGSEKVLRTALAAALGLPVVTAVPGWSGDLLERLQWKGMPHSGPFTHVVENRSGIITVTEDGIVFGNGMYDGRFNTDLKHDTNGVVRPYALSLMHPAPRHVLMIGLSSGSWAQVIANNPEVDSLTVIEINPGYLALIAEQPEVASVLKNPKVTVVNDDGRRWLRANPDAHFDAIVSNTTWHYRANVTNLLSAEFLELARDHLNVGGIFFYNTTDSPRVQRTGCLIFAHGARFTNHMVASEQPIAWDFGRWRRTLESYRIDGKAQFDAAAEEDRAVLAKLMTWEQSLTSGSTPGEERPIESCPDILAATAGIAPVTDDNMGSEWLHSLGLE